MDLLPYLEKWNTELTGLYNARELQNMWRILSREADIDIPRVIERLKAKEPFDYILGHSEFYGLKLMVNSAVLIPRPETEELVDWILNDNTTNGLEVLDIGSGSGCIAIALAKQRPNWKINALDISREAIDQATRNAELNGTKVSFRVSDILAETPDGEYDIIVSNPPYIPQSESSAMSTSTISHEPHEALFTTGEDVLLFYRRIGEVARKSLNPGGSLFFELNEFHASAIADCLMEQGYQVEVRRDMQGKERMLRGIKN